MVALKVFFAFLSVLLINAQGFEECSPSSIKVKITKTGHAVKGQPDYEVVFTVDDDCPGGEVWVVVGCNGFTSVKPIEPFIFKKDDSIGGCLLRYGGSLYAGGPLKFKYAGQLPTDKFRPISSQIECS
ncbi:uncharacterized protein LOC114288210 [Camellia sinensis]|uniref:uncharacterized protein LOC114288210 n=1 Tax=Camellia sinensis TaxID=4442 RepID=UPI00103558B1|nr:uncharacterized protein LOC114288210 [Camellia sinensis]